MFDRAVDKAVDTSMGWLDRFEEIIDRPFDSVPMDKPQRVAKWLELRTNPQLVREMVERDGATKTLEFVHALMVDAGAKPNA